MLLSSSGWMSSTFAFLREVWTEGAYGLTYGEIILALGILLVSLLIRGFFARTIIRSISKAAAGTQTQLDDALVQTIATPLKIVPVIIGFYFATLVIDLEGDMALIANRIVQSAVAIAVFWTLARAVQAFEFLFVGLRDTLTHAIVDWMVKALQVVLIILGFGAVVDIWGYSIAPVIASLGVLGIAVGLGAQDLFKNLIAGVLILTERRFVPGEWIKVDGVVEGTVEKINFRSTLIRRFDKSPVFVPNATLSDNAVTNFARMTHRRIKWVIGVEYRTTVPQLHYIRDEIEAWLWMDPRFTNPPETALFVRIDSFNDSSIDFLIYCFTKTTNWGEWLEIKEELAVAIMGIVERAGTSFAFPSRTLYMQEQDPPEVISPPEVSERVRRLLEKKSTASARGGEGE